MQTIKRHRKVDRFDIVNTLLLSAAALLVFYPFYNSVLVSITPPRAVYTTTPFMLFPQEITFQSYEYIFRSDTIFNGFKVTGIVVVLGVLYSMFLTVTMA